MPKIMLRLLTVGIVLIIGAVLYLNLLPESAEPAPTVTKQEFQSDVVLAAGDIASCQSTGDEATASLLGNFPEASIITLGDNVYDSGKISEFMDCFEPSWGQFKTRMFPAVGNHDYGVAGAADFFAYFNREKPTYYSFDLGYWHLIALDSNCSVVGCSPDSEQDKWLSGNLAANTAKCTLAYMHHPRFSSGLHGNTPEVVPLWEQLYQGGVDLVLSGHDHHYERFAPLAPTGYVDNDKGMRHFIVGTGGKSLYEFKEIQFGSEQRNNTEYGVLKLTLDQDSFKWNFLPINGGTFTDKGTGVCH